MDDGPSSLNLNKSPLYLVNGSSFTIYFVNKSKTGFISHLLIEHVSVQNRNRQVVALSPDAILQTCMVHLGEVFWVVLVLRENLSQILVNLIRHRQCWSIRKKGKISLFLSVQIDLHDAFCGTQEICSKYSSARGNHESRRSFC